MTPGARVQAAIEILAAIERDWRVQGRPADGIIRNYFRSRRYAGSKDRAAVTAHVYGVLRRRAELLWRLEQMGIAIDDERRPRLLMVAALAAEQDHGPAALFDGGPHAPAPLTDDERRIADTAAALSPADAPDWVRANVPEWLASPLQAVYGADWPAIARAMNDRAPLDLRVNVLKTTRDKAQAALARDGIATQPTPYSPVGLRAAGHPSLANNAVYTSGRVEVQDEGSQLAALLVDARPGMQVVDLCAGGGGKTLALAAAMERKGQIFACDSDGRRLRNLAPRLKKAAAHNVQTRTVAAERDPWLDSQAGLAHRVLVDAPCSGTGTWRRNPDLKWRLSADQVSDFATLQSALLARAARLVRPDGRLVYVTCSLLAAENEQVVDAFLGQAADFRILPIADIWPSAVGGACPLPGDVLRLNPRDHGTDGFFVAVMERTG